MTSLDKLLKKLTCTQYTFAELQVRPLPEGVDPLKIESYLVDSEFQVNSHGDQCELFLNFCRKNMHTHTHTHTHTCTLIDAHPPTPLWNSS